MTIKSELVKIAGATNVFDDTDKLRQYSKDYSLNPPSMPSYVVLPQNAEEVQKVVRLANENKLPVTPCSSGVHFYGNALPAQAGIVLDLKRMNKILSIDDRNRMVRIEPGVTWGELQAELQKKCDLMAIGPLFPHPEKSALTSHLEREPGLIPKFEYTDTLVTMEVVLPDGELFRTGSACVPGFPDKSLSQGVNPSGPGDFMWNRLFQGAQGTLGVATWVQCKIENRPRISKTFCIPFKNLADAVKFMYKLQRRVIGEECFIVNNFNLAAMLAQKWPSDFDTLRKAFAPWTIILVLGGSKRLPEAKIEYEEEALREVAAELSIASLSTSLPGLPGLERQLPDMLRTAWPKEKTYWKFAFKGSSQDLFFLTKLNETPEYFNNISTIASKHGYPLQDLGFYIQPIAYGGACHFESNFYYDPANMREVDTVTKVFGEAAKAVLDKGGLFSRPYGPIANMVYSRTATYTATLKKLKSTLDPNNIMAPGRLCF